MLNRIKHEGKLLGVSLLVGILIAVGVAGYSYAYSIRTQRDIAENVIRFHVMAHSDEPEAQDLKEYVRTEVLAEFASTLSHSASIDETRANLAENLLAIEAKAEDVLRQRGFDYPVNVRIGTAFFPTQSYGDLIFPPGMYEAVQIVIGDGVGSNWWCLMFPPLCYVDMTSTQEGRTQLSQTVSEEGFRLLTHQEADSIELNVRFRVVQWWQNRRAPDTLDVTPGGQVAQN